MPRHPSHPPKVPSSWPPDAWRFHAATSNAPWITPEGADTRSTRTQQRAKAKTNVSPHKKPSGRGLTLPAPRSKGEFVDVLRGRRTWRGFGTRPITKARLAQLLSLTFAPTMTGVTAWGDQVLFKTSPSAGSLHPIEAYVLAVNVSGVPPGLYLYSTLTDRLHVVRPGATARDVMTYLSGQWWYAGAAALVLMTARVPRVWARYPHARAYRSLLLDAGHVGQTFCLVATWLKLAPFCTQALADAHIERHLRIDGVEETVLYAAGVGSRPRDGQWVQWPDHAPGHPFLPPQPPAVASTRHDRDKPRKKPREPR